MSEIVLPSVMSLFGTGYLLGRLLDHWKRRRVSKQLLRWCVIDPSERELDGILKDPEHIAFLIGQLRGMILTDNDPALSHNGTRQET